MGAFMIGSFAFIGLAALVNLVGGSGWIITPGPHLWPILWILTLSAFVGAGVLVGQTVSGRWDGVLVDRQNRISLSRFQLIGWTLLILSALFAAGLQNIFRPGDGTLGILDITIHPQIWGLLGLSAFTAVTASAITAGNAGETMQLPPPEVRSRGQDDDDTVPVQRTIGTVTGNIATTDSLTTEPIAVGRTIQKATAADARWIDMIRGDSEGADYVDAAKFQQLVITVLIVVVYGAQLWQSFARPGFITEFLPPSEGMLALIGISHATYLADKKLVAS
jgi:hypothetical protein